MVLDRLKENWHQNHEPVEHCHLLPRGNFQAEVLNRNLGIEKTRLSSDGPQLVCLW